MGTSASVLTAAPAAHERASADFPEVLRALDTMVASAEPAVVFTSAVRLCVPLICDVATVTITADDQPPYAITWPRNMTEQRDWVPTTTVRTAITGPATEEHPAYSGTLTLDFHSLPTDAHPALARLIVDHAAALVQRERLLDLLNSATTQAANLELALASNRDIGVAIGILMSLHKITRQHAFDELREVSQRTNRKLRDIALDVAETGTIRTLADAGSSASDSADRVAAARPGRQLLTRCAS
jgi:ANTAR domain